MKRRAGGLILRIAALSGRQLVPLSTILLSGAAAPSVWWSILMMYSTLGDAPSLDAIDQDSELVGVQQGFWLLLETCC